MLTLVRLDPPPDYAGLVKRSEDLPPVGAAVHGLAVRCRDAPAVRATLSWLARTRAAEVAFALVLPRDTELLRCVALDASTPVAVLFDDELHGDALPSHVIDQLWGQSFVAAVEIALASRYGQQVSADPLLRALIRLGARGARAASAARSLGRSEATLRRALRDSGLRPLGSILRESRLLAFEAALDAGMDRSQAARLCGWVGTDGARTALRRQQARARPIAGGEP